MNKIICGDFFNQFNESEINPYLKPESFDLICIDPPYNIGLKYDSYKDSHSKTDYYDFASQLLEICSYLLKPNGSIWIVINDEWVAEYIYILKYELGFHFRNHIVWHYNFGSAAKTKFSRCHTNLLYYSKDKKNFTFNPELVSIPSARMTKYNDKRANPKGCVPPDVWCIPRVCGTFKERNKIGHPAQLPLELTDRIVLSTSNVGDLCGDFMCGTGTFLVSCKKFNREFIGVELSSRYVKEANRRLSEMDL